MPRLNAHGLKCILVLFPDEVVALGDVPTPRVTLTIEAAGYGPVHADIAAKSLRKCQAVIAENGSENVATILQGKLASGGQILEAGLMAQIKQPKPVEAAA